jgi:membrane protein
MGFVPFIDRAVEVMGSWLARRDVRARGGNAHAGAGEVEDVDRRRAEPRGPAPECWTRRHMPCSPNAMSASGHVSGQLSGTSPGTRAPRQTRAGAGRGFVRGLLALRTRFVDDEIPRHAAAIGFYTSLSLAPLVVLLLFVLDAIGGVGAAQLEEQVGLLVGPDGAQLVRAIATGARESHASRGLAGAVGVATLLVSASGVFVELQRALNRVWGVAPRPDLGWKGKLRKRLLSFAMLGVLAFLLLVSLAASTAVALLSQWSSERVLLQAASIATSLLVHALLFALVFRVLPDVRMSWRDVVAGSLATAGLFTLGKWAIGLYLAHLALGSAYGAASSLAVVIVWVYFSSMVVLVGAQLTEAWAAARGRRIEPNAFAVPVESP